MKKKISKQEYIDTRNSFIKTAEAYANQLTKRDKDNPNWNRLYFLKMDELSFESGLQEFRFHPTKGE